MIQSLSFLIFLFFLVVGYFLTFFSFFHLTNFNCGSGCGREEAKERSVREQIGGYFCLVRGFLLREFFFGFGSSSEIRVFRFAIVRNSVPEKTERGARSPFIFGIRAWTKSRRGGGACRMCQHLIFNFVVDGVSVEADELLEGAHMAQGQQGDEFMVEFEDDAEDLLQATHERISLDTDSDDENDVVSKVSDTTTAQASRGKDIQGIPWDRLQFTREKYRETRLQQYKNYENLLQSHDDLEKECKSVEKGGNFYHFRYNTRSVKSTIVHFQLRNLVWATSKHDVYLMHNFSVMHWSPMTRKGTEVLNLAGPVVPASEMWRHPTAYQQELGRVQISTMCVKRNLLVAGGFQGEMVCKNLDHPGVSYCAKITHDENAITNAIEIYDNSSGAVRLMTSNNDSVVRVFDCNNFSVLKSFYFPWAVNHTSVSPDSKAVIVVGDYADGLLSDSQTGKVIATLKGHLDYSFASAWHPDGQVFVTGNQDMTCRLWDIRNIGSSLAVLKGRIGAIRSIRFTADGRFMAMAEPADFVHVFDTKQDFAKCQEIDLFGEVAGISFSPDAEALYVGVADRTYGSLLEFNQSHANSYLNCFL